MCVKATSAGRTWNNGNPLLPHELAASHCPPPIIAQMSGRAEPGLSPLFSFYLRLGNGQRLDN